MAALSFPAKGEARLHRAKWVIPRPGVLLENGYVQVADGRVTDVGSGRMPGGSGALQDHGEGVLMPALVNAHTHLELSALAGRLNTAEGFQAWVLSLIHEREATEAAELRRAARDALAALPEQGCAVVGEISTLGLTAEMVAASPLSGVWFREVVGPAADPAGMEIRRGRVQHSLAGHAPHTTPPETLIRVKTVTRRSGARFAIHLAESEEETRFLMHRTGPWAAFLASRGIETGQWGEGADRPIPFVDRLGILDRHTLAVHLLTATREEMALLGARRVAVCVCPRSNWTLHRRLPDISGMLDAGLTPCLGTDSLASAESLSVLDEMAFIARRYPALSPEQVLAMATVNGAAALGLDGEWGTLEPGRHGAVLYLPHAPNQHRTVLEHVIHGASSPTV